MPKIFNVTGACRPDRHYMVDLGSRLKIIRSMVDDGEYFSINRARQYGKTTILRALTQYLKDHYLVVSLDFQRLSSSDFIDENAFVKALVREIKRRIFLLNDIPASVRKMLDDLSGSPDNDLRLAQAFDCFSEWCGQSEKPIVLIIDEVDTASNNQVFIDFLAQLRAAYLDSDVTPAFQSVILAGVYDIRNIRRKIRPDGDHKQNSPWNIAAKFRVDMSFEANEIAGMLKDYEADYHTGMNVSEIAGLIYDYTSGYPYLVSSLCKYVDEEIAGTESFPDKKSAWSRAGFLEAVNKLLSEKNTLFESLIGKLNDYPELKDMIYQLLFQGQPIAYNADDPATDMLLMFGFIKAEQGTVQIANRIFETRLYNYFLTLPEVQNGDMYRLALRNKNQFIKNGQLDMEQILAKFVQHFNDIYGDRKERFVEEDGRRFFMLYLKPIINETGNYYVESRTRNQERTDLIVDWHGTQYIIELKIWRGNAYNERGEKQLSDYLDHYHLKKGYMLSFNFNKDKKTGIKQITIGDKVLVEAVV